jgi:agmatine deiminase
MNKEVRIGLVQFAMSTLQSENHARAGHLIELAVKNGAEIVALPELFSTPYFCTTDKFTPEFSEELCGPTFKFLKELATKLGVGIVGGSIHENDAGKYYNTSLIFDSNGSDLGHYRKTHIPHDEGFFEKNFFEPGDTGFPIFNIKGITFGVLICYDQWFPEAARALTLAGADIIFYPTAIGAVAHVEQKEGNWHEAWENVMRGHAIANGTHVVAINRVGTEGSSTFWGGSFVCDAFGKTIYRAGAGEEAKVVRLDLSQNQLVRNGWGFLRNRRPEIYKALIS